MAAAAQRWHCRRHYGVSGGGRRFLQLGVGGAAVAAWSWQQCNRERAVAAALAEEESSSCISTRHVLCSYCTNLGTLSSLVSIWSLQGFKVLFQRRIFSRPTAPTARKIPVFHSVGDVFLTDRTQFSDRTQKLTRQIEVEGRSTQTPSKKVCGRQACGRKTGP